MLCSTIQATASRSALIPVNVYENVDSGRVLRMVARRKGRGVVEDGGRAESMAATRPASPAKVDASCPLLWNSTDSLLY